MDVGELYEAQSEFQKALREAISGKLPVDECYPGFMVKVEHVEETLKRETDNLTTPDSRFVEGGKQSVHIVATLC